MKARSPSPLALSLALASVLVVSVEAEVTWLHPSDGQYFPKGQSIQASWSSDSPVVSPSFRLCSSMDTCGTAIWPTITKDDNGNSHISLTAPPMDSDTPFFLTMRGDDMQTYSSPSFTLLAGSTPIVSPESAPDHEETAWDLPEDPITATDDPVDASTPPASTPTATTPSTNDIPTPLEISATFSSPTTAANHPTAAAHAASAPLATPPAAAISSALPPPLVDSDAAMSAPNKPNVKAIAFPLGALALICLGALIFLLRRKPVDPPAPSSAPAILDLEKAVGSLNEKAAESAFAARGGDFGGAAAAGKMAEYATVATLAKEYPSSRTGGGRRGSGGDPFDDDHRQSYAGGRQASSRHSNVRSQYDPDHAQNDGYTSPPRRGSRAALAPSRSESTLYRPSSHSSSRHNAPTRHSSIVSSSSLASSYAPTPAPPRPTDSSRLAPPQQAALYRQPSSVYSPGSAYTPNHNHASTPAFRPSPGGASDDDRGMHILSFPWSHTPYTPSMSPPYLPTLRGVPGRSGMGVDRRDTRRERGGGRGGIYSDAEDVLGRERERRRGGRREMEELYGDVQRGLR